LLLSSVSYSARFKVVHNRSPIQTLPFIQSLTDQCSENIYKKYINLKNSNHKLVLIFLEDGKMASPMSFLFLGSGKIAMGIWWLHHGGSIPYDHMVFPKSSNGTQRHVTYNIQAQNSNLLQKQKTSSPERGVST
jgi:hypothetical protein